MRGESELRAPVGKSRVPAALACLLGLAFAVLSAAGAAGATGRSGAASAAAASVPPPTPAEIRAAKQKLAELGFWAGPADGRWDETARQALVAFQKSEWRKPTGKLTRAELREVMRGYPPSPRESGEPHLEVDLARQILFQVDAAGKVSHILPISSGSGKSFRAAGWGQAVAETPCGHFSVFAKLSGWQHSPLGEMHNPMFIVGGIAIHGSESVPARPVSHGCIRIPMFASRTLTRFVPRNTPVVVYGCTGDEPRPLLAGAAGGGSGSATAAPAGDAPPVH
jgi:hypothetical protein